jgi:glycosyltransferase involved in cell wall biosynthesis
MVTDFFYPLLFGGGERQMYEVAKRLAKDNEVHIVTRRLKDTANYEMHEGMHIHRVFVPSKEIILESNLNGDVFMISSFIAGLKLGKFDIYSPQQFFPIPPIWLLSKIKKTSIVPIIHDLYQDTWIEKFGYMGRIAYLFEKFMIKLPFSKIITVSHATKDKLSKAGVPEEKIKVVYNGVDIEKFNNVLIEKATKPQIVYLGRLVHYKHIEDLILAFSKLDLDATLFIIGEGPEKQRLQRLAINLKISNKVVFTGFVDETEKIKILKSSHVLVLPSTTEGFGIALIEAMAAKTAVIAADIPAVHESVEDGETGLLYKARDVNDLKIKMEMILENAGLKEKLIKNGYTLVKKRFTWDVIFKKVERLYESVLD